MSSPAKPETPLEPLSTPGVDSSWVDLVTQKVATLHFGVVQIVIHNSKVVQVESTERHRFDLPRPDPTPAKPTPAKRAP